MNIFTAPACMDRIFDNQLVVVVYMNKFLVLSTANHDHLAYLRINFHLLRAYDLLLGTKCHISQTEVFTSNLRSQQME